MPVRRSYVTGEYAPQGHKYGHKGQNGQRFRWSTAQCPCTVRRATLTDSPPLPTSSPEVYPYGDFDRYARFVYTGWSEAQT